MDEHRPDQYKHNPFSSAQWIAWMVGLTVFAVSITNFAYSTFITKSEANSSRSELMSRLDRLETKLDQLLLNQKKGDSK